MNEKKRMRGYDSNLVMLAMGVDSDYDRNTSPAWVDTQTGEILFVFETDEEAYQAWGSAALADQREQRIRVHTYPDRYLRLPEVDHGDWHEEFQAFLKSIGREAEYSFTIGGWLKERASQEDRAGWEDFKRGAAIRRFEAFMSEHGIACEG